MNYFNLNSFFFFLNFYFSHFYIHFVFFFLLNKLINYISQRYFFYLLFLFQLKYFKYFRNFFYLKECSHVIFGHQRQQGFGTILMMIYAGSKVYLSLESPLYNWFKSKNVNIYSIENDLNQADFANFPEDFKKENKEIISTLLSEATILNQLNTLLQDACQLFENKLI